LIAHSASGSIHFVCMDWRHLFEVLRAARELYTELKNLCVWNKDNSGLGSLYRSKHELVLVFKNGYEPHINNVELGRYGAGGGRDPRLLQARWHGPRLLRRQRHQSNRG